MARDVAFAEIQQQSYEQVWEYQTLLHKNLIADKLERRNMVNNSSPIVHHLLFCEHNPVYTLGKSGSIEHLLLTEEDLKSENIEFFKINRGGDITYHGPGQLTGYPIFDLDDFFTDVHLYVRKLEEVIIQTIQTYGLKGERLEGYTGVWIKKQDGDFRKICAIGVHLSRWVTMHGFAFNINTDLSYFDKIIPCGIVDKDKSVTSLARELGYKVNMEEVKRNVYTNFKSIFDLNYIK